LEYRSFVGPAALDINLIQPFVDDVTLELDDSNKNNTDNSNGNSVSIVVYAKFSSHMGSIDLFVNKKGLNFWVTNYVNRDGLCLVPDNFMVIVSIYFLFSWYINSFSVWLDLIVYFPAEGWQN
jgi:hypothetical protein